MQTFLLFLLLMCAEEEATAAKKNLVEVVEDIRQLRTVREPLLVAFVANEKDRHDVLNFQVADICDDLDIDLASVVGKEKAKMFGLSALPEVVYFEDGVPSLFKGSHSELEEWILEQRTASKIEVVTEEMLEYLSKSKTFVAVLFTGPCHGEKEIDATTSCKNVLNELEKISADLESFGLDLVVSEDIKFAGKGLDIKTFPAFGIFRNTKFLQYNFSQDFDANSALGWLLSEEVLLRIDDELEEVPLKMVANLVDEEKDFAVLFYDDEKAGESWQHLTNRVYSFISVDQSKDDALKVLLLSFILGLTNVIGDRRLGENRFRPGSEKCRLGQMSGA